MSRVMDLAGRGVLHRRGRIPITLAALGWFAVSGCASDEPLAPPAVGGLTVTITTTTPVLLYTEVRVTGPGEFEELISATFTFRGLEPGTYTVTAVPVTALHPVVGTARYDAVVSNPTIVVTGGAIASVSVNYVQQPGGTGAMWVANAGHASVVSISADHLLANTGDAPSTVISTVGVQGGAVSERDGDLWLSEPASDQVVKYMASELAAGGALAPAVVLSTNAASIGTGVPASLEGPTGLALDDDGNLWVANSDNNTVVAFAPGQLESSGGPTPVITLSSNSGSLDQPTGMIFAGDLWVANRNNNTLVAFSIAQRAVSGAPVPAVTLQSPALASPIALAYESIYYDETEEDHSRLWVSNFTGNTVVNFAVNQLHTSGVVAPSGTLRAAGASLSGPAGLAFDQSGALWVANHSGNTVVRFTDAQLASGGAQTPEVIVGSVALAGPAALAFYPLPYSPCDTVFC
jgi:sugar lactone lactonase YvrE